MKVMYAINEVTGSIIEGFFVDEVTGERSDYSIEDYLKDIRQ